VTQEIEQEYAPRHFYGVLPVFLVDEVVATAEYYRDVLGFEVDFVYGEPPTYARLSRDDAIIDISRSNPAGRRNSVTAAGPGNGVDALMIVTDVDELYDEMVARGAQVRVQLASHEYGMREFHVEDANGYVLVFAEEIET
jgi:uncharacterized glyoxalase superfamily protein PhnB